jgi:hypothetical protein
LKPQLKWSDRCKKLEEFILPSLFFPDLETKALEVQKAAPKRKKFQTNVNSAERFSSKVKC